MLSRNDVLQKVNFYKTRKAIYNTDVVNRRNLLLFGTTAIRGGVEQCTSVYIAQRRVLLCKNVATLTGCQCWQRLSNNKI